MIKSIVSSYSWTISEILNLYADSEDFLGLEYWYNHIVETVKKEK